MVLFLSTFVNKIDRKGRVSVPASFRAALASHSTFQGFVAFRSYKHQAVDCCSFERMTRLSDSLDALDVFSDVQDDLAAAVFADAQQIPFDSDGRIILPKTLIEHAELQENIAFVGRGNTFQLWHPNTFEMIQNQARLRMKEAQTTLRLREGKESARGEN